MVSLSRLNMPSSLASLFFLFSGSSLADWTLTQPNGTITASNGVITMTDTGASAMVATLNQAVLHQPNFFLEFVLNNPNGNYGSVSLLDSGGTARLFLTFKDDGTVLDNNTSTSYSPPNWNPLLPFRVRVFYSAKWKTCRVSMLYISTASPLNADESQVHYFLGAFPMAAGPRQLRFQTSASKTGNVEFSEICARENQAIAIGDSTTAGSGDSAKDGEWNPVPGWKPSNQPKMAWPYWYQLRTGLTCVNYGVASLTLSRAVPRITDWNRFGASGVFIGLGTNDIKEGRSINQMTADLDQILSAFAGSKIHVLEILPRGGQFNAMQNEQVRQWNAYLNEAAKSGRFSVVRTFSVFEDSVNANKMNGFLSDDGTHPNIAGHFQLAALASD
jgi:lysophospholipase L1-like esterase